jgi:hypothetical protein
MSYSVKPSVTSYILRFFIQKSGWNNACKTFISCKMNAHKSFLDFIGNFSNLNFERKIFTNGGNVQK